MFEQDRKQYKTKNEPVCPTKVCVHVFPLQSFMVESLEPEL